MSKSSTKRKKKLGNYPYLSVVFSMTLALIILALLGLVLVKGNRLKSLIKENIEVQIYLKKLTSEAERIKLQRALTSKEYLALDEEGDPRIQFISKEEAAKDFVESTEEDFLDFLGNNPLLDVLVINVKEEYYTQDGMETIEKELSAFDSVLDVEYEENLINSINRNILRIGIVLMALAGIFLLIVVMLINNTIKLAMFSQRFLIRSMQLVGATSSFIQWPFLKRSLWHSLISTVLACGLVYGLLQYGYSEINELRMLYDLTSILALFAIIFGIGISIGFFSTYRAINKYMNMRLDDLY